MLVRMSSENQPFNTDKIVNRHLYIEVAVVGST